VPPAWVKLFDYLRFRNYKKFGVRYDEIDLVIKS
jgi:hypothetical protein